MSDADAPFVDGQRFGDLASVGDNGITRQPHIFLTACGPRRGEEQLQGGVDGDGRRLGVSCDPFDDARFGRQRACVRRGVRDSPQFFAKGARPKDELRLIRLDQTLQPVAGEGRIDQRRRVTGRGRGKQTDHRFGIGAAEQKNELFLFRGDRLGEPKAGDANLLAGQPDIAAIVANRRRCLKRRDQRKKPAARRVQIAHRNSLHHTLRRLRPSLILPCCFQGPSNDEATVDPDDLSGYIR